MGNSRWRFTDYTFLKILKMDITTCLSLLVVIVTLATSAQASEPRVVCYYTNWSVYRPGTAKFNPQNINPYLCTHLIYAFGAFTKENTLKPFDKYQDIEKGGYAKFTGLKTYNKNLKTLLAIGGWNEGSTRFSPMVASRERRKEFVRNAIKFLRQNRFDGLDLDWEYPAFRDGGKPKDRDNYAKLVKELREEFEKESEKTGKPRLLLTMAVPAGIEYIQKGFDVKTLNKYLDWMNLLTYDYHSAFEPAVNHHAPLFPLEEPNEYSTDNELNIDYTIKFYIENGADPNKLVLGIPTYGRSYTLFNPDAVEIGSPADGPGEQGDATREKGYLAYYEICEALKPKEKKRSVRQNDDEDDEEEDSEESTEVDEPWTVMYPNPNAMGPVAFKGNQWVGYDDVEIVKKKAEYVAENGLGGIMFWSIDNDDFRGNCHEKPYPLIEAAKEAYIAKLGATDNAIVSQPVTKASAKRRNRPRVSTTTTTTAQPSTAAKTLSSKRKSGSSFTSTTPAWNVITPEPPTTPDPGADFKCKDEGFFPHPRDCKKYFWCLDSGPSNLGIVAHQFTCPSGLFFNKAADSCDFARNVLCKKPSATTKAPAKITSTTTTTTTTTRKPIKLSTKNLVLFRTTTTTTTTPEPESEEEVEEEVQEDTSDVDAEDPKVIKELIDLIKKVGGVEQLEKHLRLSETSVSTDGPSTTPSSLNKKLYKVLERTRGKNKFLNSVSEDSSSQNSRRGPQNAGLEPTPDKNVLIKKDRPQYITINRSRPTTTSTEPSVESEEVKEKPAVSSLKQSRSRIVESEDNSGTTSKTLQYVNIRRAPPASTSDTADDTASRNALFERVEPYIPVSETPSTLDIISARRENMPEYVTIRRQRPTTEETTTAQYLSSERSNESQGQVLEREISSQPQYTSIVRTRSTTLPPIDDYKSPEPTTILAVQISSLLNSPSPTEAEVLESETEAPPTEDSQPTTVPSSTTTTTTTTIPPSTTTTTTALSLILPSSIAPRPLPIRRRGSTTLSPLTTIQVSPRNYTFVSRRRLPVHKPNEILTDSDETNEVSRKIRSTTPNSREVTDDKVRIGGQIRQVRRKRIRVQPSENIDDSEAAAASPVSRGQFRPQFSRDEVVSLTPVDHEPPLAVQRPSFIPRNEKRFRGRTTVANNVEDSEVSAATLDVRRPSFPSRGRGKFTPVSTTAINEADFIITESTPTQPTQRKPTITRFTPRPFNGRRNPLSEIPVTEESIDVSSVKPVTQRVPSRFSFGNTRPLANSIQGRKLPFPYRQQPSTEKILTSDDDDLENKPDDISLSESTIEEKEHEDDTETTTQLPKRRIIIKKLRTPLSSTTESIVSTETANTDENNKKRLRVIRRRPTSTTIPEPSSISTENPTPSRIKKIIRKKLKPLDNEPGIIAKSINSLNASPKDTTTEIVFNYGEKTISTTASSISTPSIKERESEDEVVDQIIPELLKVESSTGLKNEETDDAVEENKQTNHKLESELSENNEIAEKNEDKLPTTTENQSTNNNFNTNSEISNNNFKENAKMSENPVITEENKSEDEITKEDNKFEIENSKLINKPEIIIENNQKSVDLSEIESSPDETPVSETEEPLIETKTTSTTQRPTPRTRLPYRPSKKLFSSSTEGSVPSSSRTFSRKYNPGAYTSPASADRENLFRSTTTTRRPLFTPRQRRPYTTAKTTTRIEEEEEYSEEEILDEEPESPLVFVPANLHFPRKTIPKTKSEDDYDNESEEESDDENSEEEKSSNILTTTSRKPNFIPRVVNSNSFRAVSTTESFRKPFSGTQSQNRTTVQSRFASNKPINETKKRVQNVPVGYNSPVVPTPKNILAVQNKTKIAAIENVTEATTTVITDEGEMQTVDDDYLSMTESTTVTLSENTNIPEDITSTNKIEIETATMEISKDDYLEYTVDTTTYPSTQGSTSYSQTIAEENTLSDIHTSVSNTETNSQISTETFSETTTNVPVTPIIKTQFDKLFSVSRVVEVSSKLDKHRLNKNNETTLIEEGKIMVEKKPVVDKIGEVSRFSFIKIVEDEIPIYLTKLGHIYPVENLPDNPIRIDEARNARALTNFAEAPRENLIASESINEAYRHIKKATQDNFGKDRVERVAEDDFLSYINEDKKSQNSHEDLSSSNWQFIPAAYENEKLSQNKAAKSFEIITPRSMLTDPSTLPLEALFQTERPRTAKKIADDREKQPFVVYSASLPTQKEEANIVKLQVIKPESGRSIVTFAKGQEFNGAPAVDESTVKYPVSISVFSNTSDGILSTSTITTTKSTTTTTTTEKVQTSPIIELLTSTEPNTLSTESETVSNTTTTDTPSTTEIVTEETTTQRASLFDTKRSKFAFPRRPVIKPSNVTRPVPRTFKKPNTTSSSLNQKPSKTFTPSGRYTSNRAQNVPVDIRKSSTPKNKIFSTSTEAPRTTTERRVSFKPIRPGSRPAFVPRRNRTTTPPTTES